jgi:hypothetical protein
MTAHITCPACGHVLANHERGIGDADIVAVLNERDQLRAALEQIISLYPDTSLAGRTMRDLAITALGGTPDAWP